MDENQSYYSPEEYDAPALSAKVDELLEDPRESADIQNQIQEIFAKHKSPAPLSSTTASTFVKAIKIVDDRAGIEPGTVSLLVSLAPLIKELVPLVQPFANKAADVAGQIALDIWDMIKLKLLKKNQIRLRKRTA